MGSGAFCVFYVPCDHHLFLLGMVVAECFRMAAGVFGMFWPFAPACLLVCYLIGLNLSNVIMADLHT